MKKNETLKAKEYEQMKKSDDGYFKDFFQVLEDKPKTLAIEGPKPTPATEQPVPGQKMLGYEVQSDVRPKTEKPEFMEL